MYANWGPRTISMLTTDVFGQYWQSDTELIECGPYKPNSIVALQSPGRHLICDWESSQAERDDGTLVNVCQFIRWFDYRCSHYGPSPLNYARAPSSCRNPIPSHSPRPTVDTQCISDHIIQLDIYSVLIISGNEWMPCIAPCLTDSFGPRNNSTLYLSAFYNLQVIAKHDGYMLLDIKQQLCVQSPTIHIMNNLHYRLRDIKWNCSSLCGPLHVFMFRKRKRPNENRIALIYGIIKQQIKQLVAANLHRAVLHFYTVLRLINFMLCYYSKPARDEKLYNTVLKVQTLAVYRSWMHLIVNRRAHRLTSKNWSIISRSSADW